VLDVLADVDGADMPDQVVEVLEQVTVDRAQFRKVAGQLGRAIRELNQPGERQAGLGIIEGSPFSLAHFTRRSFAFSDTEINVSPILGRPWPQWRPTGRRRPDAGSRRSAVLVE
jgi:hypothetical protein